MRHATTVLMTTRQVAVWREKNEEGGEEGDGGAKLKNQRREGAVVERK